MLENVQPNEMNVAPFSTREDARVLSISTTPSITVISLENNFIIFFFVINIFFILDLMGSGGVCYGCYGNAIESLLKALALFVILRSEGKLLYCTLFSFHK